MGFLTRLFDAGAKRDLAPVAPERRGIHPSVDQDWSAYLGAAPAINGLPAPTVEGSLALPAVFACIRVLSETVASLPLLTYRTRSDGSRERAGNHRLLLLLHRRPNPEMTAFELGELSTSHCAAWGNAYDWIELSNSGQVLALWPLRPDRMKVRRRNGVLEYPYLLENGQTVVLPAWQVHHRRALGGDGIVGYSPLRVGMLAVSLGMATEEFGARFFAQGARPGFVLSHPGELSDKAWQKLDARWNGSSALTNAHRVKIIEEGMKVEKIGIPPEEAQFLQTRIFQAQEVARLFRMPPHKIGLLENATFSNIEHQAIEFVVDTIRPWLIRFEQAMWRDLLGPSDQQSIYMEYLVDGLLRGDTTSRYNAYAVARQWGWLSVNDIRRLENLDRIDGGDTYLQPLNMVQAGAQSGTRAGAQPVTWLAPVVQDAARSMARREAADLRAKGAKVLRTQPEAFDAWLLEFYEGWSSATCQRLAPAASAAADASGRSVSTMANLVGGVAWDTAKRGMERIRMVVAEAAGQGETPADALERYAGVIESAGGQVLGDALMASLAEVTG